MFHVFGVDGRLTSGGLDQLRQVSAIRAAARIRPLAHSGLAADGERHGEHQGESDLDATGVGPRVSVEGRSVPHPQGAPQARAYVSLQAPTDPSHRQPLQVVAQVMSTDVLALGAGQALGSAWAQLRARGVAQAPVVAGWPGDGSPVVGLLWSRDLLAPAHWPPADAAGAVWQAHTAQFWARPVTDCMVSPVPAVAAETRLRSLAEALLAWALPGLPVAGEDGRLAGFVSRSDLLKAMVAEPPLDLWG